ncbi:MAG: helix-turn-helix domain-containing protein [Firmicutes bacterium]|nr:helix-turn-helix domain-containing protein [Bacillota bacterium]
MNKKKWNAKSIILYISITLILLLIYEVFNYYNTLQIVSIERQETNQAILKQIKTNVESNLLKIDHISYNIVSDSDNIRFVDSSEDSLSIFEKFQLQNRLLDEGSENPYINSICLYAPKINKVLTNMAYANADELYDKEWLDECLQQRKSYLICSNYNEIEAGYKKLNLYAVRQIQTQSGTLGLVIISINPTLFREAFYVDDIDNFMAIRITDKDNIVLYDTLDNRYISKKVLFDFDEEMLRKKVFKAKIKNTSFDVYHMNSDIINLNFFILISRISVFMRYYTSGLIMLILIVILMTTYIFIRKIERTTLVPMDNFVNDISSYMKANYDDVSYDNLESLYCIIVENDRHMKKQISSNLLALRWRLIMEILKGEKKSYDDVEAQMKLLQMNLYSKNYIVMVVEFDRRTEVLLKESESAVSVYLDMIYRETEKCLDNDVTKSIAIKMQDDRIVCILSFPDDNVEGHIVETMTYANILQSNVLDNVGESISVGIGGYYADFFNISNSYQEAVFALEQKFLFGEKSIISIEDVKFSDATDVYGLSKKVEKLKKIGIDEMEDRVKDIFDEMSRNKVNYEIFHTTAMQIIVTIFDNKAIKYNKGILSREKYNNIYYYVNQIETLQETCDYILNMIRDIKKDKFLPTADTLSSEKMVKDVIRYIHEHYDDPELSLNNVAEVLGFSAAHISREFKKINEINFIDYVIDIRIKKAKDLLQNSNEKISDISTLVGYVNANSFMRIFKRYTGITPSAFRNENK